MIKSMNAATVLVPNAAINRAHVAEQVAEYGFHFPPCLRPNRSEAKQPSLMLVSIYN